MEELPLDKKIILFDGVCNLCNNTVQAIIKKDKKDMFRFVALQSELGQKISKHIGIDTNLADSIILYEPGVSYYVKSEAALQIASELGGIYSIFKIVSFLPTNTLDCLYNFIAKNRYKWYGKKDQCMIPTSKNLNKFL